MPAPRSVMPRAVVLFAPSVHVARPATSALVSTLALAAQPASWGTGRRLQLRSLPA